MEMSPRDRKRKQGETRRNRARTAGVWKKFEQVAAAAAPPSPPTQSPEVPEANTPNTQADFFR